MCAGNTPQPTAKERWRGQPLKTETVRARSTSRLLSVVSHTGHVDYDRGLVSYDPSIVSRGNVANIAGAILDFRAVIHSDAQAARKMVLGVGSLTTLGLRSRFDMG